MGALRSTQQIRSRRCLPGATPDPLPYSDGVLIFSLRKKYVGSWTLLPNPVLTIAGPTPLYRPLIPSLRLIFRKPSREFLPATTVTSSRIWRLKRQTYPLVIMFRPTLRPKKISFTFAGSYVLLPNHKFQNSKASVRQLPKHSALCRPTLEATSQWILKAPRWVEHNFGTSFFTLMGLRSVA